VRMRSHCALLLIPVFLVGCKPNPGMKLLAGSTTVYQEGFANGYSQLYVDGDLRNLPNTCVDGLQESFQPANFERTAFSEVLLYARNPATVESDLASLSDASKLTDAWDREAAVPQMIPNPLSLPASMNIEGQPQPSKVTALPTSAAFWGTGPPAPSMLALRSCAPLGSRQRTTGAEVNAYAFYNHGQCDYSQDLNPVLQQVLDGLWSNFTSAAHVSDRQSHYRHAISVIELGQLGDGKNGWPAPASNVRGGFLLTVHFRGNIGGTNNEVWATYKYLFSLDNNGIVQISKDDIKRYSLDSSGIWGWDMKDGMRSGLETDLPKTLNQQFAASQEQTLPTTTCNTSSTQCGPSSDAIANLITPALMQTAGVPSPTADQVSRLRCAMGSAVECQKAGRAAPNLENLWDCPKPVKKMPVQPCNFRVPAKRLLMFPDSLELVWFDDFEFDNPTFGLFVLAQLTQSQGQLCNVSMPAVGVGGFVIRQFAHAGQFH
jgi:hypothetical protein